MGFYVKVANGIVAFSFIILIMLDIKLIYKIINSYENSSITNKNETLIKEIKKATSSRGVFIHPSILDEKLIENVKDNEKESKKFIKNFKKKLYNPCILRGNYKFLQKNVKIVIPRYQRDYSWDSKTLKKFLYSVKNNQTSNSLGEFLIHSNENEDFCHEWFLVDGQQRITTIVLIETFFISKILTDDVFLKKVEKHEKHKKINDILLNLIKRVSWLDLDSSTREECLVKNLKEINNSFHANQRTTLHGFIDGWREDEDKLKEAQLFLRKVNKFFKDGIKVDDLIMFLIECENIIFDFKIFKTEELAQIAFYNKNVISSKLKNSEIIRAILFQMDFMNDSYIYKNFDNWFIEKKPLMIELNMWLHSEIKGNQHSYNNILNSLENNLTKSKLKSFFIDWDNFDKMSKKGYQSEVNWYYIYSIRHININLFRIMFYIFSRNEFSEYKNINSILKNIIACYIYSEDKSNDYDFPAANNFDGELKKLLLNDVKSVDELFKNYIDNIYSWGKIGTQFNLDEYLELNLNRHLIEKNRLSKKEKDKKILFVNTRFTIQKNKFCLKTNKDFNIEHLVSKGDYPDGEIFSQNKDFFNGSPHHINNLFIVGKTLNEDLDNKTLTKKIIKIRDEQENFINYKLISKKVDKLIDDESDNQKIFEELIKNN